MDLAKRIFLRYQEACLYSRRRRQTLRARGSFNVSAANVKATPGARDLDFVTPKALYKCEIGTRHCCELCPTIRTSVIEDHCAHVRV